MLTASQLTTFAAALAAETDATLAALRDSGQTGAVAAWYNEDSSTFYVWRNSVPLEEYRGAITWTEVDALTAGAARIWEWITGGMTLPLEPSNPEVRQGLADCWGAGTTTRTDLIAASKRLASRAEELFATGTGSEADPAVVDDIAITDQDVIRALEV